MVVRDQDERTSAVSELFQGWGYQVWDGVSEDLRRTYPTSVDQLRIVQYDSCRGLEGWTVFNIGLDDFYDYKLNAWKRPEGTNHIAAVDDFELASRFAARWLLIPCSRAIDTLVLNIKSRDTGLGQLLSKVYSDCRDFTEWIDV